MITFEKIEIFYLGTTYFVQNKKDISIQNALDSLNFDIKADGIHLLPNLVNQRGLVTTKSVLFHGRRNIAGVHFQLFCHDVPVGLKIRLTALNGVVS